MKFDLDSSSWIVEVKEVMALIPEFTHPEFTHYGYELRKNVSDRFLGCWAFRIYTLGTWQLYVALNECWAFRI